MATKQTFIGAVPTPTTGADVANNGAHSPATLDQNFANLRKTADDAATALGGFTASQTAGINQIPVVASDKSLSLPGGVKFPATQVPSSDPNTLDDYEKAYFTPTIVGTVSAGTGTYTAQYGTYTKEGNAVHFRVLVSWTAHDGTGYMKVGGLPFVSTNSRAMDTPVTIGYFNNITLSANNIATALIATSTTLISLAQYPVGGGAASSVPIDSSGFIELSGTYFTS